MSTAAIITHGQSASPTSAVTVVQARPSFETAAGFQLLNQMASVFCQSHIVPTLYRANKANCMIACAMASRMGLDSVTVMQNLYIIQGKPSWSSQFLIGLWNQCGRFTPVRYEWAPDRKSCRATSMEIKTGDVLVGTTITMAMAKAEGWLDKAGSKWKTMPEQMLMYRAAAFMIRAYAPEVALGLMTVEEGEDITGKQAIEYTEPNAVPGIEMQKAAGVELPVAGEVAETAGVTEVSGVTETQTAEKGGEIIDVEPEAKAEAIVESATVTTIVNESSTSPAVTSVPADQTSFDMVLEAKTADTVCQQTIEYIGAHLKELAPDKAKDPEKYAKFQANFRQSMMNKFQVEKVSQLTEDQAQKIVVWLKEKVETKRLNNWAQGATGGTEQPPFQA